MAADAVSDIFNVREADASLLTSGQPTEAQLESVARAGVKVVINLAPHDGPRALADEANSVGALGMDYVHIPVPFSAPAEAHLAAFFEAMDANRARPRAGSLRREQARDRFPGPVPRHQARLDAGRGICVDAHGVGA